jgi:hypothetical protein
VVGDGDARISIESFSGGVKIERRTSGAVARSGNGRASGCISWRRQIEHDELDPLERDPISRSRQLGE